MNLNAPVTSSTSSTSSTLATAGTPAEAQAVLDFWFADGLQTGWPTKEMKAIWFGGGPALDALVKTRFGDQVLQAVRGGLEDWEQQPLSRLALILLLDQFTRNVFRGSSEAFEGDARAQQLAKDALAKNWDQQLPLVCRVFLYLPLTHAENLVMQDEGVSRFTRLLDDAPQHLRTRLQGNLDSAALHREIIAQFGRFPHRNTAMGRTTGPEEERFLQTGPRFGQ